MTASIWGGMRVGRMPPQLCETLLFVLPAAAVLMLVFAVPLAIVFKNSVTNPDFTLRAFLQLYENELFARVLLNTLEISIESSVIALIAGYIVALHLAYQPPARRALYMVLVLLPFWTSILVKSYAFLAVLGRQGLVNQAISLFAGEGTRIELLFNRTGVLIGMTHYLVPFVVFPVLANLLNQDPNLVKAARIMGAGPWRIFWQITFPLSRRAVLAGFLMTMVLAVGSFVTPALLGGRKDMMIANLIDFYTRETLDWNMASAIAVTLLLVAAMLILALMRARRDGAAA